MLIKIGTSVYTKAKQGCILAPFLYSYKRELPQIP